MFEQLVVSARREPRKRTTAKFFLGTSALHIRSWVAFAVSVLLSDPKLADTENILTDRAGASCPWHSADTLRPQPPSKPVTRPDPNNSYYGKPHRAFQERPSPLIAVSDRWDPEIGNGPSIGPPGAGSPFGVIGGDRTVEPATNLRIRPGKRPSRGPNNAVGNQARAPVINGAAGQSDCARGASLSRVAQENSNAGLGFGRSDYLAGR
jgi:hypothetical protein